MVKVKKILGDDIFGLWHVKQIIINNDGKRFSIAPDSERFSSKEEAEIHAHDRAQHFIQRKLAFMSGDSGGKVIWKGETVRSVLSKTKKLLNRFWSSRTTSKSDHHRAA